MHTTGRLIRSAWVISSLTLVSRVLGLVREQVFGYYFATSEPLSAFRIAFMLPNLARRLFGEGALSAGLIPVLTRSLRTDGEEASRRFVGSLLVMLVIVLGCGVAAAELVIAVWRNTADDLSLSLAAVLLPYMLLICTVAAIGAVLNVRGHFAVPAAAPVLLNVAVIAGVVVGASVVGLEGVPLIYAACFGVLAGGVLQLLVSVMALKRVAFLPNFGGAVWNPQVKAVATMMAPMVLGLSAVQINTLVDFLLAYLCVEVNGERVGPAVMGFAQYLYQLPLGVFGIALATAIFPLLSQKADAEDYGGLADAFGRGFRLSVFVALPASVGMIFIAHPLVAALYQHGEFTAAQTDRVSGVLVCYSLGMAAYFAQHIVVRTFYALHDSKTPARVAMWMVVINFAMNLSLVFTLQERGLALATATCAFLQVAILLIVLSRRFAGVAPRGLKPAAQSGGRDGVAVSETDPTTATGESRPTMIRDRLWSDIGHGVLRSVVATCTMGVSLVLARSPALTSTGPTVETIVLVVAGVSVYALVSRFLHAPELSLFLRCKRER